ncbi:MAG: hypothetical protein U0176_26170 [Bacteroidia bacterium]
MAVSYLDNLILHLICTLLVFRLARRMGLREMFAAFVALAFAIHPMHLESVAWDRAQGCLDGRHLASLLS